LATYCPACGAEVDPRAVICPKCGVPRSVAHPNAILAIILNIFFPGVGTLVLGKTTAGIIQLVLWVVGFIFDLTVIGVVLGLPMYAAAWIWALVVSIQAFSSPSASASAPPAPPVE